MFFGYDASQLLPTSSFLLTEKSKSVQAGIIDEEPLTRVRNTLNEVISLEKLLYKKKPFISWIAKNHTEYAVDILSWVWVIDDWARMVRDEWYEDVIVSRAEAIKTLVLLKTLRTPVVFNELLYYDWRTLYDDMRRDAWYTPYVVYASEKWWLQWFDDDWLLKPLHPLSYKQYTVLIKNMKWKSSKKEWTHKTYITKRAFMESIIYWFEDILRPVHIMYGNNSEVYTMVLKSMQWKSSEGQKQLIEDVLTSFSIAERWTLLETYWYSIQWILLLLEASLEE